MGLLHSWALKLSYPLPRVKRIFIFTYKIYNYSLKISVSQNITCQKFFSHEQIYNYSAFTRVYYTSNINIQRSDQNNK